MFVSTFVRSGLKRLGGLAMGIGVALIALLALPGASEPGSDVGSSTGSGANPAPGWLADAIVPTDPDGRVLNLDFEDGTLNDWVAEGEAFDGQPVAGDLVSPRRGDMRSGHRDRFWIGGFERLGDAPRGTLTSVPFPITHPYLSFWIAGGTHRTTRVEVLDAESGEVLFNTTGDQTEQLKPVLVDLRDRQGDSIRIRLVDDHSGGWGHLNFDHVRFHATRPDVPARDVPPPPDAYMHAGLDPEAAAEAMEVPEGFEVVLAAAEPEVRQPIAMCLDDRGRLWIAEAYNYPLKVAPDEARDRILIFEDEDGDGRFDRQVVFAEGLNLVSGIEVGFDGVFVGAAPELLFIPDRDGDDRPDGPPEVLLDGWGYQDTHETLNAFIWGPDGWLYGCHGVFTHSRVGRPGTPDRQRVPINAGVWRYHPTRDVFEVFAHGTSNPWGVDFDDHGQAFITACVIPHFYHLFPGGRYERQAGQHFNPYTYDDIKTIADHVHYLGDQGPHAGNGRSDAAGGGHAHCGLMVYLGDAWPDSYRNRPIFNNIHGARLNMEALEPSGSGFVARHQPDFLMANDTWSQIINIRYGPDGQAWMIDWYDQQQCHRREVNVHDRTNGRIFKVRYGDGSSDDVDVDLARLDDEELVALQTHRNDWYVRHARRRLQERAAQGALDPAVEDALVALAKEHEDDTRRLRGLWALHVTGLIDQEVIAHGLEDPSPFVRAWTIQLAMEDQTCSLATLETLAGLASADPSPRVRLALASALQKLPIAQRWAIVEGLITHSIDSSDHNLPLMIWYGFEPAVAADPERAFDLARRSEIDRILPHTVRRIAGLGTDEALAMLVVGLGKLESDDDRLRVLREINEALKGRRSVAMPTAWPDVAGPLKRSDDAAIRNQVLALGLTFGDPDALAAIRSVLADRNNDPARRREAIDVLVKARDSESVATLIALIVEGDLRGSSLRALASFDDPRIAPAILEVYATLSPDQRRDALNTLTSRLDNARALLAAIGEGTISSREITADIIRQLQNLGDSEIDARLAEVWGTVRGASEESARTIARYQEMLQSKPQREPDVRLGRAVFDRVCAQCHRLFDHGGNNGPELTGSNRADLEYVLANVLDPNALIGKDYQAHLIATVDGRILTGIIREETRDAITLATANDVVVIPQDEVEERVESDQSLMPMGLWDNLDEHEVRSLVQYLAAPEQVPPPDAPATDELGNQ